MKRIISIKPILAIVTILLFAIVFKSCKKVDNNKINNQSETLKEAAIQSVKKQYGDVSAGIVFKVDKQADLYFYKNATGNMVNLYGENSVKADAPAPPPPYCLYNCNNTSNPANLHIVYTLDYVQRFYLCESSSTTPNKSKVSVKWTVSVPFLLTDGVKGVQPIANLNFNDASGGNLLSLSSLIYTYPLTPGGQPGIQYLGPDPACPTNSNLYEINYMFENIDDFYFNAGNQITASLSLPNDCSLVGYLVATGNVAAPAFSQDAYLPCNRIDKVYANPFNTYVLGNNAGCTQPNGWSYPDFHQLEYRQVTATSLKWADQTGSIYWGTSLGGNYSATFTPFTGIILTFIQPGSGDWLIRYRNVKTGTCGVIFNTFGNNSGSQTPLAGGNWGNPALWVTDVVPF